MNDRAYLNDSYYFVSSLLAEGESHLIEVYQLRAADYYSDWFGQSYIVGALSKNDQSGISVCFEVFHHLLDASFEGSWNYCH